MRRAASADDPFTWIPTPAAGHWETYRHYLQGTGVHWGLVHDAHLAALAVCNGLTLCSSDSDFARFDGLRCRNPLAQQ